MMSIPVRLAQPTIERESSSSEDEQDDAAVALAIAGGGATTPGGSAVMMAQPVPAGEGELPTGGVGVAVPFDSIAAEYSVGWIREDGEQLPATLDVSIEGVRVVLDADRRTVVLFADYYHIKSWDVSQQKFGLKLMEQPPQGGGSIELSFSFLTVEARVIAGAVKAQVDQLILEKQNGNAHEHFWDPGLAQILEMFARTGIGEAIVRWVSRYDIAGIWVAFFPRRQRDRC